MTSSTFKPRFGCFCLLSLAQTQNEPRQPRQSTVSFPLEALNLILSSSGMPDLNSVPPSPHSLVASRRQSTVQMTTPPVTSSTSPSLNILPSNQNAVNQSQSSLPSPVLTASHPHTNAPLNEPSVGPGPLRHPRPLTTAELHHELEKEQEAVVGLCDSANQRACMLTKFDRSTV